MWRYLCLVTAGALAPPKINLGDYLVQRAVQQQLNYMADLKNEPCGAGVLVSTLDASAATLSLRAGWETGSRPSRTTLTWIAIHQDASRAPTVRPSANSTSPTPSIWWTSARRPKKQYR